MRVLSYLLDLIVPGLGLALSGKIKRGLVYGVLFACLCVSCLYALCYFTWHPFLVLIVLTSAGLALAILAVLEDRGNLFKVSFGAIVLWVLGGLLYAFVVFIFRPSCGFLVVRDACEFPGLFPGEVLLFHKTNQKGEAKVGQLVVFEDENNGVSVARIVAIGEGVVEVFGSKISVNDRDIEAKIAGKIRLSSDELRWEAEDLVLYVEGAGDNKYPVFYKKGVIMEPKKSKIRENEVALLCDNRSTAWLENSSNLFVIPRTRIVGYPGRIVWSFSEEKRRIRSERIGAIWR